MKSKYRIVFHDGPMGNREKSVDVYAENFDDARKQAWQMDEAKCRLYSDMMIEKIPEGPPVIGIEFEFEMNSPPFYEKGKDYLFIKANDESDALRYYNSHFKGGRYNRDAGKSEPGGCRVRGRALKTYFACTDRYCADATLDARTDILADKIFGAQSKVCRKNSTAELERDER